MTQNLIDTTFSAKNLSSLISVYEYTVLETGSIGFQVRLAGVAGGGDYSMYLTLNDGDLQTDDKAWPKITYTAAAGETAFWLIYPGIDVMAGDVINVMVLGQAGDTNESGSVRIFGDNYAVAADIPTANIAAIKAKTDLLPSDPADESNILDAIAAIPTETATVPFMPNRVTDSVGDPLADVDTWVNTNSADSTLGIQARAFTNALGLIDASFNLVPGVYYVWRQHNFYSFDNPETVTVV